MKNLRQDNSKDGQRSQKQKTSKRLALDTAPVKDLAEHPCDLEHSFCPAMLR